MVTEEKLKMISMSDIARRLEQVEDKTNHLVARSELTLHVLSVMIEAGIVTREGVDELIRDVQLEVPGISPAIITKEKETVATLLNKAKIS